MNFCNKKIKQKLSSVQKITYITVTAGKKNNICVSEVLCSPTQSAFQIKYFHKHGSVFSWNPQQKREKLANNYM